MTRKEFDALTRVIKTEHSNGYQYRDDAARGARLAMMSLTMLLADELAKINPRFDRARFLRACGMEG